MRVNPPSYRARFLSKRRGQCHGGKKKKKPSHTRFQKHSGYQKNGPWCNMGTMGPQMLTRHCLISHSAQVVFPPAPPRRPKHLTNILLSRYRHTHTHTHTQTFFLSSNLFSHTVPSQQLSVDSSVSIISSSTVPHVSSASTQLQACRSLWGPVCVCACVRVCVRACVRAHTHICLLTQVNAPKRGGIEA